MPTYQYACTSTDCGNQFELVQSFTDAAASECPTCSGPVRKVFSAVGVVFKGSGFYRTDNRNSVNNKGLSTSGSDTSGGSSDSGSSSSSSSSSSSTSPSASPAAASA